MRERTTHMRIIHQTDSARIPPPWVVYENPALPHQIIIRAGNPSHHRIAVSCNCMAGAPLETRARWDAADTIAVWRKHLAEQAPPAGRPP